jgi:hypothetical protein
VTGSGHFLNNDRIRSLCAKNSTGHMPHPNDVIFGLKVVNTKGYHHECFWAWEKMHVTSACVQSQGFLAAAWCPTLTRHQQKV